MTKKTDRAISKALGIEVNEKPEQEKEIETVEGEIIEENKELITINEPNVIDNQMENDFQKARERLDGLVEKANTAIDDILFVAKESEQPRAYEVAAKLIETAAKVQGDITDLYKKKKDINARNEVPDRVAPVGGVNVDKAVFIGSPSDLLRNLKSKENDSK